MVRVVAPQLKRDNEHEVAPPPLPKTLASKRPGRGTPKRPKAMDDSIIQPLDLPVEALTTSGGSVLGELEDPLAPVPFDQLDDVNDRLREDESVLAEALALRRRPHQRLAAALAQVPKKAKVFVTETVPEWIERVRHPARKRTKKGQLTDSIIARLDRLDRRQRAVVVAVPYVVAAVLGIVALVLHSTAPEAVEISPEQAASSVAAAQPAPPSAAVQPAAAAAADAQSDAEEEPHSDVTGHDAMAAAMGRPPPRPSGAAMFPSGVRRRLPIRSSLRVAPDVSATRASRLRPGTSLITYPSYPAPDGWMLARVVDGPIGPIGPIGFIAAANLDGRRDKKLVEQLRKRKRRRRSRYR